MKTDISQAQMLRPYFESYCDYNPKYKKIIGACLIPIVLFKIWIWIGFKRRWKVNIQNICLAHMHNLSGEDTYVQGKHFEYLLPICA